jgi:hypothetical protein
MRRPNNNTTGFKGVTKHQRRYQARIQVSGKKIHGGSFATPEEASEAYKRLAIQHFGEFARWR